MVALSFLYAIQFCYAVTGASSTGSSILAAITMWTGRMFTVVKRIGSSAGQAVAHMLQQLYVLAPLVASGGHHVI